MRTRFIVLAALLLGLLAAAAASDPTEVGDKLKIVQLALPKGDPAAGRQAFVDLGCSACHRVAGDPKVQAPLTATATLGVPELGPTTGGRELARLVTDIVAPSHEVSAELAAASQGRLSPMGDFADAMTVRQLIDLVAYLRALGEEG